MARVLEDFPSRERADSKYPWTDWGDGRIWELELGVDFTNSAASMRQTVAKAARRRGQTVKTRVYKRDDKTYLVVQFKRLGRR